MVRGIFTVLCAWIVVFLSFHVGVYASNSRSNRTVWGTDEAGIVASNNMFALKLFKGLRSNDEKNIFFSPFSISSALMMTMLGAKGTTAEQMFEVLHFDEGLSEEAVHGGFKTLLKELLSKEEDRYVVHIANRVYMQEGFRVLDTFKDATKEYYDAESQNLDFQSDIETARKIVNEWVEDMTRDKIKEVLKPGVLSSSTRMVLVNAIYFKGNWLRKFNPKLTRETTFYMNNGETTKIDMMYQQAVFRNGFNKELNAHILELPYRGKDITMVVVLPMEKNCLISTQNKLPGDLTELTRNLPRSDVEIYLPKFKLTCEFELGDILQRMGMQDLFTVDADLSGMIKDDGLFFDQMIHKTFIEVNEEGSEAAAATAGQIVLGVPDIFLADHPFLFYIKHQKTNLILFMGRYVQPDSRGTVPAREDL